MPTDRTLAWGDDQTEATYVTGDTDPAGGGNFVVAEDTDGSTVLLEWDNTNNQWVSRGPVEMSGNDITNVGALDATSLQSETVNTDKLVVGGTLYEEDANSPIDVSAVTSHTYTVSGDYDSLVIIAEPEVGYGFDELQVNGDTGTNYDVVKNSDTTSTGNTAWSLTKRFPGGHDKIILDNLNDEVIRARFPLRVGQSGQEIAGSNSNVTPPVSQFTLIDSGGTSRDFKARVYGSDMSV